MKSVWRQFYFIAGVLLGTSLLYSERDESYNPAYDMSFAETHWAFVPLEKPPVPVLIGAEVGLPVDAFVIDKLKEKGLELNPAADRRTLIRRLTYDLTGLPPTFEDVQSFVNDTSPDAYERLVESLLESPAYGERWARHWLDVARYADTKGIFRRGRYSFSYTYRDYVIRALNEDKPYNRFIMEQLAADQLELDGNQDDLAAMGFLTLGRTFFGRKDYIIDDQIDVVTRGLQALTVSCARCHDHKSDPIPTADYYSLHGVFNSSRDAKELPVIRHPERDEDYQDFLDEKKKLEEEIRVVADKVIDKYLEEERSLAGNYLNAVEGGREISDSEEFKEYAGSNGVRAELLQRWIDYLAEEESRSHPVLRSWFSEYESGNREEGVAYYNEAFAAVVKEEGEWDEEIKSFLEEEGTPLNPSRESVEDWIGRKIRGDTGELTGKIQELDWTHPGAPIRAHILEDIPEPKDSPVYKRGDPKRLGEEVPRQYLQILANTERSRYTSGSGRLELAKDIASPDNPLTARVFVNRVWGWHMSQEIVDTPSDFGVRTPEPIHIDLLNWLAASFIESGWSVKDLHRQIVLSRTYQQSNEIRSEASAIDPKNELWHHFPRTRLDFESMRDTILAVSDNLDYTMGGIQVDITDPETNRRTVYSFVDRQDMPGIFRTFDHPSPDVSSPGRFETTVPQQALFLMNSPFVNLNAKRLVESVRREAKSSRETVTEIYRRLYQRDPSADEIETGLAFIQNEAEGAESSRWDLYAQALLLSNELMFLD
jgi:hypothetical protein